jgi:hypothetical protein
VGKYDGQAIAGPLACLGIRYEPSKVSSLGWYFSGTDATFSVGVVAVVARTLAVVWIEDED